MWGSGISLKQLACLKMEREGESIEGKAKRSKMWDCQNIIDRFADVLSDAPVSHYQLDPFRDELDRFMSSIPCRLYIVCHRLQEMLFYFQVRWIVLVLCKHRGIVQGNKLFSHVYMPSL